MLCVGDLERIDLDRGFFALSRFFLGHSSPKTSDLFLQCTISVHFFLQCHLRLSMFVLKLFHLRSDVFDEIYLQN